VPAAEVTIAGDGEILTRGPRNTPGYLNLPDQTGRLTDVGGWLHTGDIGSLDRDGFLSVTGRKKDLIITSGGENISPAAIENLLIAHPLIGQALSYADRRPYLVALLTLDGDVSPAWATARGIQASSPAELAAEPAVLAAVGQAVAGANQRLARVQQVKRWRLLPAEWTAESEDLTPTFKLRRPVVHAKYADVIDARTRTDPEPGHGGLARSVTSPCIRSAGRLPNMHEPHAYQMGRVRTEPPGAGTAKRGVISPRSWACDLAARCAPGRLALTVEGNDR
jgi:long-subunit acyl-CoA synthetase (AMP-forming)